MCNFWPFRKSKQQETAMTIEKAVAIVKAKIATLVANYAQAIAENKALKKENAALNDEIAADIISIVDGIPSGDGGFENSNQ